MPDQVPVTEQQEMPIVHNIGQFENFSPPEQFTFDDEPRIRDSNSKASSEEKPASEVAEFGCRRADDQVDNPIVVDEA